MGLTATRGLSGLPALRRGILVVAVLVAVGIPWLAEPPSGSAGISSTQGDVFACYGPAGSIAIPDNGSVNVPCSGALPGRTIGELNVFLTINHTWVGDLKVTLTHYETGTSVVLIDRPGYSGSGFGCSSDNISVELSDSAATFAEDQCGEPPAISGYQRPNNPLSAFAGESLGGTWTLTVEDLAGADTGELVDWLLFDPDNDQDGCTAAEEIGSNAALGGRRSFSWYWDFYDTFDVFTFTRDRIISTGDVLRVVQRFQASGPPAGDPLAMPIPPAPAYHASFDRSPPSQGGDLWDLNAPDGVIATNDILFIVRQFGHSCAGQP